MLDYLIRKEKVLMSLKEGLTNKGHSFKQLSGINARLDLLDDIKYKYNIELLTKLIENTNYSMLVEVLHGLDNLHLIYKEKSEWYLYAINRESMNDYDIEIIQKSFLDKNTLIYISEKSMGGNFISFYVVFSKVKYNGSHEYINRKWQG